MKSHVPHSERGFAIYCCLVMVVFDAYGVDLSSVSQFISTQLTMWPLVCFFFIFIASSFMSTSNYDIIGMRFIPFYSAKRQPVRIGV